MRERNIINVKTYFFRGGDLVLGSYGDRLCLCNWMGGKHNTMINYRLQRSLNAVYHEDTTDVIELARQQLNEYFFHKRQDFDLPLLFVGTDFQKKVWDELGKIPFGETASYSEVAERIGVPKAFRAVANANALNAINVIVPCHRVIGNNGSLKGYNGGVEKQQYLIDLEQWK